MTGLAANRLRLLAACAGTRATLRAHRRFPTVRAASHALQLVQREVAAQLGGAAEAPHYQTLVSHAAILLLRAKVVLCTAETRR